ncbi:MAG: hypothetical protein SWJ54_15265 [Cyanobacteriota bacterium]|nr:hypothetical protein [Cyanobacteriota bacterium]
MNLSDYPQAIANVQQELLKVQQRLRTAKETVAFCLSTIDRAIAFDRELKNDAQRKAKRKELLESDSDYIEASQSLSKLEDLQVELEIELGLLRNQFSVLKLDRRESIAQIEAQVNFAA